jgi:hypothetical protein
LIDDRRVYPRLFRTSYPTFSADAPFISDFVLISVQVDPIRLHSQGWYLIKNKDSAAYLRNFAKRARKYELGLTTITQDVEDFLSTEDGKAIITNSSLQIILKQSTAAVDKITETFYLTGGEKHFLLSAGVGEGLFFASQNHVGFRVIASDEERQLIGS